MYSERNFENRSVNREEETMQTILTVQSMRESDARTVAGGTPGRELMARAAKAIFEAAEWNPPVAVVCGKGNNGGDGYALACLLQEAGIECTLLLQGEPITPDAAFYLEACRQRQIPEQPWGQVENLSGYRTVADCIFGTGFHGEAGGEAARMIEAINRSGAKVVSADINSGINGDNGLGPVAVRSDLTVSIGSLKPGHFLARAKDVMKQVVNADIGIPPAGRRLLLTEEEDVRNLLPPRLHHSNKGTYGTISLIGGSLPYSGAIRLAGMANAAMHSGVGIARVAAPRSLCPVVASAVLESTLCPMEDRDGNLLFSEESLQRAVAGTRVTAFGMGAGNTEDTRKILQWLLQQYNGILILDADGLNALAAIGPDRLRTAQCRVILTPHPGEFARLNACTVQEVQEAPVAMAEAFARNHHATVLLKGSATLITDGETTYLSDRGCPGMATAGSGDVLSGILAALCAWLPDDLLRTTAAAAWINGRAGELAQRKSTDISMTAGDTVRALPEVFGLLRNNSL